MGTMKGEIMQYTVDEERLVCRKEVENIDCYYPEDSDDLKLAKGILNGFAIEFIIAISIFVAVVAI
jgi:hypothetical protein